MLDNRGFTLVEMLFSLFIISVISLFSLSYQTFQVGEKEIREMYIQVKSLIEEARTVAITSHSVVSLNITNQSIGYQTTKQEREVLLTKGIFFTNIKNIYFNKNGTINRGNHIYIGTNTIKYKIVFTVGSGDFYLQQ